MGPETYQTKIRAFKASGALTLELSIPKGYLSAVEKAAENERCYFEKKRAYKGKVKVIISRKPESFY